MLDLYMSVLNTYGGLRSMALVTMLLCSATSEVFPSLKGFLSLEIPILGFACGLVERCDIFVGSNRLKHTLVGNSEIHFWEKHWSTLEPHLEAHDVVPSLDFQIQRMKEKREPLDRRWWEVRFLHWRPVHVCKSAGCNWSSLTLFFISLTFIDFPT